MTIIGDNIKKLRERNDLTLRDLAQKSCVGQSTINDIEMGKAQNPKIETLNKISETLNVSLDYLLKKSANALIEDKLEELGMTLEELSTKTKIPMAFFEKLDAIIPDEGDYERIQIIARTLDIEPIDLANALHRQEPPVYEWTKFDDKHPYIKEESTLYETGEFTTPEAAMQFILKQPAIMGFGGFNVNKMSDEDIIEFANELLNQLKLISYKYKK